MRWVILFFVFGLFGCITDPIEDCRGEHEKIMLPDLPYLNDTKMTYAYNDTNGVELIVVFDSIVKQGLLYPKDSYCKPEYEAVSLAAYDENFTLKIIQVAVNQNSYNRDDEKLQIMLIKNHEIILDIKTKAPEDEYEVLRVYYNLSVVYSAESGIDQIFSDFFTFKRLR